ncbi:MAG: hypothetical protein CVU38_21210 [Chloroflexi bacterium HGW-Chloroflexi-1]|nr:MAG: hypothetical protein CVU38_21210 [Chloroflexi bacterium HGW-Chloroflexi-1]
MCAHPQRLQLELALPRAQDADHERRRCARLGRRLVVHVGVDEGLTGDGDGAAVALHLHRQIGRVADGQGDGRRRGDQLQPAAAVGQDDGGRRRARCERGRRRGRPARKGRQVGEVHPQVAAVGRGPAGRAIGREPEVIAGRVHEQRVGRQRMGAVPLALLAELRQVQQRVVGESVALGQIAPAHDGFRMGFMIPQVMVVAVVQRAVERVQERIAVSGTAAADHQAGALSRYVARHHADVVVHGRVIAGDAEAGIARLGRRVAQVGGSLVDVDRSAAPLHDRVMVDARPLGAVEGDAP